ncbi:MAG TPA: helix-turn-helix domain-containing protein [Mycobacteriales bacterium]|nr:helix-turn-helix domain-containing protein [Mycobacteriales bacterium]
MAPTKAPAKVPPKAPATVTRALHKIGEDLATWRRLRRLTVAEVADRAGVGASTVTRLENGGGANLANLLRVARALGVLDMLSVAVDPYSTDIGRVRADEALPERVRHRRST